MSPSQENFDFSEREKNVLNNIPYTHCMECVSIAEGAIIKIKRIKFCVRRRIKKMRQGTTTTETSNNNNN